MAQFYSIFEAESQFSICDSNNEDRQRASRFIRALVSINKWILGTDTESTIIRHCIIALTQGVDEPDAVVWHLQIQTKDLMLYPCKIQLIWEMFCLIICLISKIKCLTCRLASPSSPHANDRTYLTTAAPRLALIPASQASAALPTIGMGI